MGLITTMSKGLRHIDAGLGPGPLMFVAEMPVSGAASYLMGRAYHRWENRWYGKHIHKLVAGVGKIGAIAIQIAIGGGYHWTSGIMNTIGQSGWNAYWLEMGLRHEREKSGKIAALLPAGTDITKIPGAAAMTHMGALDKAAPGRGLSWDNIDALATAR